MTTEQGIVFNLIGFFGFGLYILWQARKAMAQLKIRPNKIVRRKLTLRAGIPKNIN